MAGLIPFAMYFVLNLGFAFLLNNEVGQVIDAAENAAIMDINPGSYLSGNPALNIASAQTDLANGLTTGFSTMGSNLGPLGYSGLSTWVGNPGDTDPFTNQVVTLPTIHVVGTVQVSLLAGELDGMQFDQAGVDHQG
ncbi:MAG: hypothetical protein ACYDAG_00510 [Chloroflexota bacterium]